MKGITPIIAIVLMLLISVAAAAGAFFFIQGFRGRAEQETGGAFGAIQSQTQSQIVIESAWMEQNGIGIRIKNVGQTAVDCTKFTAFVDGIPYTLNLTSTQGSEGDTGAAPDDCGGGTIAGTSECTSNMPVGNSTLVRLTDTNVACSDATFKEAKSAEIKILTEGGAATLFSINPAKSCCS